MVESGNIDTTNTEIRHHSLSWLVTDTSMKSGVAKLVLWAKASLLCEMMQQLINIACSSHDVDEIPLKLALITYQSIN